MGGVSNFPSEQLDERQRETGAFGTVSYLWTDDVATLQASIFARDSSFVFQPDNQGDVLFYGVSQFIAQHDLAFGLQLESALAVGPSHTVRAGLIASVGRTTTRVLSRALAIDALGRQITGSPTIFTTASKETEQQASAYVEDEWRPSESLTLNVGLRYDHVSVPRHADQISPRANAVWTPIAGTVVHVGYARYFVPSPAEHSSEAVSQLIGTTGKQPTLLGDPLRAEIDNYYDVGIQQNYGALVLDIDGYWRDATNLIDDRFFKGSPRSQPFNYRVGRIRGLDFSATYAQGSFSAWSSLAVSRADGSGIVSNQFYFQAAELGFMNNHFVRLPHDQAYTVSAGASYHWGNLLLSGDLLYGSGQRGAFSGFTLSGANLMSRLQINLAGVYHISNIGGHPIDLRLDLINLLDSRFEVLGGTGPGAAQPQWGPRRGIFVGVEQSF